MRNLDLNTYMRMYLTMAIHIWKHNHFFSSRFFGGSGIESCPPGTTMLGRPLRTESMGVTSIDPATFSDYVKGLGQDMYAGHTYDLFKVRNKTMYSLLLLTQTIEACSFDSSTTVTTLVTTFQISFVASKSPSTSLTSRKSFLPRPWLRCYVQ